MSPEGIALIGELAKNGLLAVLLALVGILYFRKDKNLEVLYEKRVEDNAKIITVVQATNTGYRALEVASENRSRVIDSVGEAVRVMAEAVRSQATTSEQVRYKVERNEAALDRIEKAIEELKREVVADRSKRRQTG
jgi:hypothetical protein